MTAPPPTDPPDRPPSIAIDGPAAVGKSTVGRRLAERLGWLYFDTGAVYRALTWLALDRGASPDDGPGLARLAAAHAIAVVPDAAVPSGYRVMVDGRDISAALRDRAVDAAVSAVSRHAEVRTALLGPQRAIAAAAAVVMVGRDIGTVVLPGATLKVFLDASPAERTRRRFRERLRAGERPTWSAELASTIARDGQDRGRATAPLAAAADARVIDTESLDADGVVAAILAALGLDA